MKGRRVGKMYRGGRYLSVRTRPRKGMERSGTERLVVCGFVFVLIVAVKLLFPQTFGELTHQVSRFIGQDTDFREAFAAMGRAVSGEGAVEDSLQDAYEAVFSSSEVRVNNAPPDLTNAPGESLAKRTAVVLPPMEEASAEAVATEAEQSKTAETEGDASGILSSAFVMQPVPENASLEMVRFGFSYVSPLSGQLTSAFGWRDHPTEDGTRFHYGVDIAAESGTEIAAFADGEVFAVGESSTLGKYIILLHAGDFKTLYAHCSSILVSSGSVSKGDVIAKVGETGLATGPHLHFELQNGSIYYNPIYYVAVW